ncbi:hypothetical protein EV182_003305 [Spiromyces aspiralis]|uniref:Uncharacterized protein n=1 Tax=Spiromyces aspiralis TaxID=68401 RepID=A0ACC1HKI7_9FUNG|nr:hypothetical protein EV182_003305 [Spiromyces aspiralis]
MALRALTDSLPKLAYELGVETRQPTLSLHETDTELLILHQYILSANPQLRPDLSNISQLIAHTVTLFECLGQPVMALVAISWWKQQCSRISQSSAFAETNRRCQNTMQQPTSEAIGPATSRAPSSTDALMSGMLDMSSWGLNGVGAPGAAASHAGGSSMNSSSSSNSSSSVAVATGHQDAKTESGNMGKDADGAVQDLPLRHNSRVTLAKQVLEYLKHNIENYDDSREGFTKDRETVLKTLGLSGHILVE